MVGPGGELFVPYDALPTPAKYILQTRYIMANGVALQAPLGYRQVPAEFGGGYLLVGPDWSIGSFKNIIRIQPPGTGSSVKYGYKNGYFVAYNSQGAAISIYSGNTYKYTSPAVHNALGPVVPPVEHSILRWWW